MSRSTLFAAGPDGDLLPVKDYSNAGRGALMVWKCLIAGHLQKEQKELLPHEYWLGNERFMEKLWKLAYQPAVSRIERICLMATFDRVLVRGPERGLLVEAFRWFMTLVEPYCHLGVMADDLQTLPTTRGPSLGAGRRSQRTSGECLSARRMSGRAISTGIASISGSLRSCRERT